MVSEVRSHYPTAGKNVDFLMSFPSRATVCCNGPLEISVLFILLLDVEKPALLWPHMTSFSKAMGVAREGAQGQGSSPSPFQSKRQPCTMFKKERKVCLSIFFYFKRKTGQKVGGRGFD